MRPSRHRCRCRESAAPGVLILRPLRVKGLPEGFSCRFAGRVPHGSFGVTVAS